MAKSIASPKRQNTITIQTPEGVSFSLPLAGPISRFLAWALDMACLWVGAMLVQTSSLVLGVIGHDISTAISMVLFFILTMAYGILLEWFWHGQTIGKKVFGLKVMDASGFQLTPGQIVIRNLLRSVDSLPLFYLVGGSASLISPYSQRLGDMAANTVVVDVPGIEKPRIDLITEPNDYNSLRNHAHLAARLRQKTLPEEANLSLQALLRRNDLLPKARLALFKSLADHFKEKVRFPEEALAGISHEQYVRNVADLIFRG